MKTVLLIVTLHICLSKKIINRQGYSLLSKTEHNNYILPSDQEAIHKGIRRFTDPLKDDYLMDQLEKHANRSKCFAMKGIQAKLGKVNSSRIMLDMTVYRNDSMAYDFRLDKDYQLKQQALKKVLDQGIKGILDEF